jgi:hypothetical protein
MPTFTEGKVVHHVMKTYGQIPHAFSLILGTRRRATQWLDQQLLSDA